VLGNHSTVNVETSDRIEIRKDARLVGDIRTARIIIEDGAYFKGSIDIVKARDPETRSRHRPKIPPRPQPRSGFGQCRARG